MSTKRDYSSIYSIKEFAMTEIAPKYFDLDDVNQLNIGLLGYTTELVANTTEDTFNSVSTFIKEMFPNKAIIPESIYNYASLFQLDNLFANPSNLSVMLFLNEADIIKLGTKKDNYYEFVLDSNLVIDIEGKQFMPDYDIVINCKPYKGDYIFTASYDLNYKNSLSDIVNPYIKTKRIKYTNTNYIGLLLKVRQVNKFQQTEYIITNDKINLPTLSFQFFDQLANFEVFYKAPEDKTYTQLIKRLMNTPPIRTPFCYYKFKNEHQIEITFTSRDNYFQPKFNSELLIHYETTTGVKGNFSFYKGNNVAVIPKSDKYAYNNNIALFAIVQSESVNGRDSLGLDEIRSIVVEKFSTVSSYTNENDLQMYFSNFRYKYGNEVLFLKRRDDAFERLFSAFAIMKDMNKDIYPTNTLHLDMTPSQFDIEYEQSNRYILKAGRLFRYKADSRDTSELIPGKTLKDDISALTDPFVYTNPFLITVTKNPSIVGFYLNSINYRFPLEYSYVNSDSLVQFICNSVNVSRNSLMGEDTYKLTILLTPTTDLETSLVSEDGTDLGLLKVKGMLEDYSAAEMCYVDFTFKEYNDKTNMYTYEADIKTDDYMTNSQKIRAYDMHDIITGESEIKLIPMVDLNLNIYAFYKYPDQKLTHKFDYLTELHDYTLTNMYTTYEQKINLMSPMNIVRSKMKYKDLGNDTYGMNISFLPLIKASTLKNPEMYTHFMETLFLQYTYMQGAVNSITNNYGIDLKFYNTYGKSKNFLAGDDLKLLDRVNCSIKFLIAPNIGAEQETLKRDIQLFVKNYIEGVNNRGYNSIYISNLIQQLENNFPDIRYLKFLNINNYDSSVQVIENKTVDLNRLTKDERLNYVPEYLTIHESDIVIDFIQN